MNRDYESIPLPIVEPGSLDITPGMFETGEPTPYTPLGTAVLWHDALGDTDHYRTALDVLSLDPGAWGDYSEAASLVGDLSWVTDVHDCPEDETIKYIRLIDYAGETDGQFIEDVPINECWVITVVQPEGQPCWFVWGISQNGLPSRSEVYLT